MRANLGLVIEHLYPNATLKDYELRDEGMGPRITRWDESTLGPGPTEQELQDAFLPAMKAQKETELIRAADADEKAIWTAEIEFKYVLIKRVLGQPISVPQQQKAQQVTALFERLETKVAAVRQATTGEAVEAITWL